MKKPALPIRNGLNPTRVQLPPGWPPTIAGDFVWHLVSSQRHRADTDDREAVSRRFHANEVVFDDATPIAEQDLLQPGTFINFYRTPAPEPEVPGELEVLFEDRDLLVVNKPPFLATLPRGQHIRQTALVKARVQFGIPELSPAHRLDRLTSGVLMFTKRPEVRGAYQALFDQRLPKKTYVAYTRPVADKQTNVNPIPAHKDWRQWTPPSEESPWVLTHRMVKIRGRLSTYIEEPVDRGAEYPYGFHAAEVTTENGSEGYAANAITRVLVYEDAVYLDKPARAWRIQPKTGRTHQLRVVLRSLGLPIINDPLYSELSDEALLTPDGELPRPAFVEEEDFSQPMGLVAESLEFTDPLSGDKRTFTL